MVGFHQYCIILNTANEFDRNEYGNRRLVKGPASFFLKPGEILENGVQNAIVLRSDEGLIVKAIKSHVEDVASDDEEETPLDTRKVSIL